MTQQTSKVDIWNRACSSIGTRSTIANENENSNEAAQCRLLYDTTLDGMLRAAHWNFARATDYLSLLKAAPGTPENPGGGTPYWDPTTMPAPPWLYSYAYPSDCLMLRYVSPQIYTGQTSGIPIFSAPSYVPIPQVNTQPQKFQVATDYDKTKQPITNILTNQQQAIGIYTRRITSPDLWDNHFQEAMTAALAGRLVIPLSGDKAMYKQQLAYARDAVLQARVTDGNEGLTRENWIPDWIAVRGYAGDWGGGQAGYTTLWSSPAWLFI